MARKKKEEQGDDTPPPDETETTLAEEARTAIVGERNARTTIAIEEVLDQLANEDAQIAFKKLDPIGGTEKHLERLPLDSVLPDIFEFVRQRYGGGTFKAVFYQREDSGRFIIASARKIEIEPSVPPGDFFKSSEKPPEKESVAALVDTILEKMNTKKEGDLSTSQLLLLMMKQSQESNAQMMTMFTSVIGAVAGKSGGNQQGIDLLSALGVFDKLKGNTGEQIRPMIELLDFTRKVMIDRAKKEDGSDSPWAEMLAQAFSAVMQRMAPPQLGPGGMPEMPPPSPFVRPMPDAPQPPPPAAVEVTTEATPPDDMSMVKFLSIKILAPAMLPKLVEGIEGGAEPEDALDMFNNPLSPVKLTDAQYDELVEVLKTETWAKDLFGGDDKIAQWRPWFDKLRELVLRDAQGGPTTERPE